MVVVVVVVQAIEYMSIIDYSIRDSCMLLQKVGNEGVYP